MVENHDLNVTLKKRELNKNYTLYPKSNSESIFLNDSGLSLKEYINLQDKINLSFNALKKKVDTIEEYAQKNQNAYSKFLFNEYEVSAKNEKSSFKFISGDNIKFTLTDQGVRMDVNLLTAKTANEREPGLMSSHDYIKLLNIEEFANNYKHPEYDIEPGVYIRTKVNKYGHVIEGNNNVITIQEGGTGARTVAEAKKNLEIPERTEQEVIEGSNNPVSSDAVYKELFKKAEKEHGIHVPENTSSDISNTKKFLKEGNVWSSLPDASVNDSGIVQLSDAINGSSTQKAATENSVKKAVAEAERVARQLISDVISGASESFDTLKEIDEWIQEHQDLYDALVRTIAGKVDKVDGKGLSTNDLSNDLKSNYDTAYNHSQQGHAPADAERNIIVSIKKNGVVISPDANRAVDISVPTKVSQLANDKEYLTEHPSISATENTAKTIDNSTKNSTSFTFISDLLRDSNQHVISLEKTTITIPNHNVSNLNQDVDYIFLNGSDVSVFG